jgi:hypothetical protein
MTQTGVILFFQGVSPECNGSQAGNRETVPMRDGYSLGLHP